MVQRIGIDMDGVILDNYGVWKRYFDSMAREHGHTIEYENPPTDWGASPRVCRICHQYCVDTMFEETELIEGAREGLTELRGLAQLWVVSHRSNLATLACIQVLKARGVFDLFTSVNWSLNSKLETCLRYGISMLVDDGPKNLEELLGSPVQPIAFDYPYNRHIDCPRAYGWEDVVSICKDQLRERRVA